MVSPGIDIPENRAAARGECKRYMSNECRWHFESGGDADGTSCHCRDLNRFIAICEIIRLLLITLLELVHM